MMASPAHGVSRAKTVSVAAYRDSRQLRDTVLRQRQHILSTYNKAHAVFPRVKFAMKHNSRLGQVWKLSGGCPELGNWVPEVSPALSWNDGGVWSVEVALPPGKYSFKCMLRTEDGNYVWESGDNREVVVPVKDRAGAMVITYHMDVRSEPVESLMPHQKLHGQAGAYSPMAYPGGVQQPAYQPAYQPSNHYQPANAW